MYSMEWSLGEEFWSIGVESDFGVAKVESSAIVVCVCVHACVRVCMCACMRACVCY